MGVLSYLYTYKLYNTPIFVAKTRNYDIFVAKIYDYALIDSFWGFPRFIDSPTSYATLLYTDIFCVVWMLKVGMPIEVPFSISL